MTLNIASHRRAPLFQSSHRTRGFSLVELMVGMAIGLVLVAGLSLLFANTSQSGNELNKSIRQIENGRYAMDLLHDDLMLAGYYGEVPSDSLATSSPDLCATSGAITLGWDTTIPSTPQVPPPIVGLSDSEASALTCLPNRLPGTRAFAVHRLDTDTAPPASITTTDVLYVQTSRCLADPEQLFDLESDPEERSNLATDPAHAADAHGSEVELVAGRDRPLSPPSSSRIRGNPHETQKHFEQTPLVGALHNFEPRKRRNAVFRW